MNPSYCGPFQVSTGVLEAGDTRAAGEYHPPLYRGAVIVSRRLNFVGLFTRSFPSSPA
jgi:hypothetical protein